MVLILVGFDCMLFKGLSLPGLQRNALKAASALPRTAIPKPLEKPLLSEQESGCIPLKFCGRGQSLLLVINGSLDNQEGR